MHRRWFIHRDLKTSNLLYNSAGKLAVCDFGLARKYEEPIRAYTPTVVTLYYRSPELLLGAQTYSTGVDMERWVHLRGAAHSRSRSSRARENSTSSIKFSRSDILATPPAPLVPHRS